CRSVRPNNSFKPKPLRYTKGMADTACHAFGSTTRFGLTQVLGPCMNIFEYPRYQSNSSDLFFDHFVLDVIGHLPLSMSGRLDAALETTDGNWRQKTKELVNLSATIEIAILDLWYRNSAILAARGESYEPYHFAVNFVDNYFADDSQIDQWHGNSLEAAKERIRLARAEA
ncbi:hypothetical protein, partial [Cognatiluteimonas telluris]|uniref:hypothetical protein n=1 Tax=Cognatiluteimonas telluris TaxID=1104775 RepID=UPI001A9C2E04